MMNTPARRMMRLAAIAVTLVPLGLAQMGGGMMGSGNSSSNSNSGMGNNGMMTGMSGSMAGGMDSMMSGPAVGPDGTAYIMRRSGTASQGMMNTQITKTDLVAINPSNGKASWTLQIEGSMVSEPVLSKDGSAIFLTTSEPEMATGTSGSGMHGSVTASAQQKPALIIVANSVAAARIQNRIEIDADMLSIPRIAPDGQTIYVTAVEMPSMSGQTGGASTNSAAATLYAFSSTGALKFKADLGQAQMGSMAH